MKRLLLVLLLFTPILLLGQDVGGVDLSDPLSLVQYVAPFIVFIAVQVVKLVKPLLPKWTLGLVVPGISALIAWLTTLLDNPDLSWLATFGLGLASTFVHQLWKELSGVGK